MTSNSEMPDLFGRATIVFGGHEGLREGLDELRAWCADVESGDARSTDRVTARVDAFLNRVLEHFTTEEGSAYFGTVSSDSVALAQGIVLLKNEHVALTELVVHLRSFSGAEIDVVSFASGLGRFLDKLSEHERRETALLQRYFAGERDD